VNCFLSDILTTVAIIIESYGRQVPIYFSVAENISNEIITDTEWVWQMLLNYLTNACKHTDEGSIHVDVSLCTEHPPGMKQNKSMRTESFASCISSSDYGSSSAQGMYQMPDWQTEQLLFQIVDSGVGVGSVKQESLFEVFSQSQSGQSAGTGLGLFSVYSRCRRLGGMCGIISPNLFADNADGSTFWFTIPYVSATPECIKATDFVRFPTSHVVCDRCQPGSVVVMGIDVTWNKKEVEDLEWKVSSGSSQSGSTSQNEGSAKSDYFPYTAFVVDDVQSIRKLLQRTLLGLGFTRVELFENGKRALDAMKKEIVDVVFMDIQVRVCRSALLRLWSCFVYSEFYIT
jgi:CheY-like chemotaxis protein